MTAGELTQLDALVRDLVREHPELDPAEAVRVVTRSWRALETFHLDGDDDARRMVGLLARREARLRLGLEREEARLDPETHRRAASPDETGAM